MDGLRFDAWTRRRFGLAAGGAAAFLAGLIRASDDVAAKKKRRKRCRKLSQVCTQGGKKKCCGDRFCARPFTFTVEDRCCKGGGERCTGEEDPTCCTGICTLAGDCFCKTGGQPCDRNGQCCSGKCSGGTCTGPV
jgi:hypothetical protein